jgi:hypothetical protein
MLLKLNFEQIVNKMSMSEVILKINLEQVRPQV